MPRRHIPRKTSKHSPAAKAKEALIKTRLGLETFKLARLEEKHVAKTAEEERKRAALEDYAEKRRIAEEKRHAEELAETQKKEALRQKQEDWYKGDMKTPYPYFE